MPANKAETRRMDGGESDRSFKIISLIPLRIPQSCDLVIHSSSKQKQTKNNPSTGRPLIIFQGLCCHTRSSPQVHKAPAHTRYREPSSRTITSPTGYPRAQRPKTQDVFPQLHPTQRVRSHRRVAHPAMDTMRRRFEPPKLAPRAQRRHPLPPTIHALCVTETLLLDTPLLLPQWHSIALLDKRIYDVETKCFRPAKTLPRIDIDF